MNICCPTCFGMVESNGLEVFIHYGLYISLIPLLKNTNRHLRGYFSYWKSNYLAFVVRCLGPVSLIRDCSGK